MVGKAVAVAFVLMGTLASAAHADSRGYCEAYARDVAERHTNGGADVLVGTLGGALTGALIGGLIDKGEGAGKGAIIGGVGGTVIGAGATSEKYQQTYERAFARCTADYAVEDDDDDDDAPAAPVRRAKRKVDRGDAWAAACAARYRSFERKTGKYKSYSGAWKTCRL